MLRVKNFEQSYFIDKYNDSLGQDTKKAIKKHDGLCQALCIMVALKGYYSTSIQTLLEMGAEDSVENILKEDRLLEYKESKKQMQQEIFLLLEEVAIRAHPLNVLSIFEKLYRISFDKLSLESKSKLYENPSNLLLEDNKTGYKINREALSAILQKCEDYQIIQLSFMEKPALKNGFSLEGVLPASLCA